MIKIVKRSPFLLIFILLAGCVANRAHEPSMNVLLLESISTYDHRGAHGKKEPYGYIELNRLKPNRVAVFNFCTYDLFTIWRKDNPNEDYYVLGSLRSSTIQPYGGTCTLAFFEDQQNSTVFSRYQIVPVVNGRGQNPLKLLYATDDQTVKQEVERSSNTYPSVIARMGDSLGFPSQAAGFSRGDTVTHEPGMKNISVGYNLFTPSAQQAVTLYFFPRDQPIAEQIEFEKQMIERFHEDPVVLSQAEQTIIRDQVAFRAYAVDYQMRGTMLNRRQPLYSQLLLIELPERYVKARSTCPLEQADAAKGRLIKLMEQIDWTNKP
jgi:hypothetical protein